MDRKMVDKIKIGLTYLALQNYDELEKGQKYMLTDQMTIPDPRGFAYYSYMLIFKSIKTGELVEATDVPPAALELIQQMK